MMPVAKSCTKIQKKKGHEVRPRYKQQKQKHRSYCKSTCIKGHFRDDKIDNCQEIVMVEHIHRSRCVHFPSICISQTRYLYRPPNLRRSKVNQIIIRKKTALESDCFIRSVPQVISKTLKNFVSPCKMVQTSKDCLWPEHQETHVSFSPLEISMLHVVLSMIGENKLEK